MYSIWYLYKKLSTEMKTIDILMTITAVFKTQADVVITPKKI